MANDFPRANAAPPDTRAAAREFQRQVDYLRANGCRCMLRWDGVRAVPLSVVEAGVCDYNHDADPAPSQE